MDLPLDKGFFSTACGQMEGLIRHNEAVLSVVSRSARKRSLPESPETVRASKVCCLSQRYVSPADNDTVRISRFIDLARAVVAGTSLQHLQSIDSESWTNMAQALAFAGIDTLEKAREMDLRLCPPCPVIHTWAALHGTTIFNEVNNPDHLAGLNYVERIRQEGDTLASWGIPVIVVYSRKGLDSDQIDSMRADFAGHCNVLCLQFESDLQLGMPPQLKQYDNERVTVHFSDALRLVLSQNIEHTLRVSAQLARSEGKTEMVERIEKLGYQNLMYSDIDNHWMQKPPWLLASRGMLTLPVLSDHLFFLQLPECYTNQLSASDRLLFQTHQSYFTEMPYFRKGGGGWSEEAAGRVYEYILSGKAEKNYRHLYQSMFQEQPESYGYMGLNGLWHGDNGCLYLSTDSAEFFLQGAINNICSIDLHQDPKMEGNQRRNPLFCDMHYKEAHALVGTQMLRYYSFGHDNTWNNKWVDEVQD